MINVYVIVGQSGEYSDHVDWFVAAYFDADLAEKHCFAATKEAKRIADIMNPMALDDYDRFISLSHEIPTPDVLVNAYDDQMAIHGWSSDYYVAAMGLRTTLPWEVA